MGYIPGCHLLCYAHFFGHMYVTTYSISVSEDGSGIPTCLTCSDPPPAPPIKCSCEDGDCEDDSDVSPCDDVDYEVGVQCDYTQASNSPVRYCEYTKALLAPSCRAYVQVTWCILVVKAI